MKAALYIRASTAKKTRTADGEEAFRQRPEIQEERLRRLCEQRGWEVAAVYCGPRIRAQGSPPQLQQLMNDARRGLFGIVAVVAFDRFARSVKHLVNAFNRFRELGIQFLSLREAIDTSIPMGKAMFTIIGTMAELEAELISERTTAAMAYTQAHGTRLGKPIGRQPKIFRRDLAHELRQRGMKLPRHCRHAWRQRRDSSRGHETMSQRVQKRVGLQPLFQRWKHAVRSPPPGVRQGDLW